MSKICRYVLTGTFAVLLMGLAACKKWLPEDLDYLSPKATFSRKDFSPILGRTSVFSAIFNTDNSTTPLTFKMVNVRDWITQAPTNDLEKMVPVWVWKKGYTGDEKSIAEIEAKREQESHPVWELREHSGDLIMWAGADSTMVKQLPLGGYLFDVEVSNSGGTNTYKDLQLNPIRELPYEPSNDIDMLTGEPAIKYTSDSSSYARVYNHPLISNMLGDSTELAIRNDSVRVLFHKTGDGNSLTFKFMDKDSLPINPDAFNATGPLDSLIHGFNPKKTAEYIRFDVAYPIPLIKYPTRWTIGDGSQAKVRFAYDRKGYGGSIVRATLDFYFAIYHKGDWEIIFYFCSDTQDSEMNNGNKDKC